MADILYVEKDLNPVKAFKNIFKKIDEIIRRLNSVDNAIGDFQYTEAVGTLTSDQINALDTTPIEIIPAQGANKIVSIDNVYAVRKEGTAYTTASGLMLKYSPSDDIITILSNTALTDGVLAIYSNTAGQMEWNSTQVNKAIEIYADAAISGGTGDIKYWVRYKVINV